MVSDSKEELIRRIESTPFDVEKELETVLSRGDLLNRNLGCIWGHSVENHVRRIVGNYDGIRLIQNDYNILEYVESVELGGKMRDILFSNYNNECRLRYNTSRRALSIENKSGIDEIDLLFTIDKQIILGEIVYARSYQGNSPVKSKTFRRSLDSLILFFESPIEYWAIVNSKRKNGIESGIGHPKSQYPDFIKAGHKLIGINVDENSRREFYNLLLERKPSIIISDLERERYFGSSS